MNSNGEKKLSGPIFIYEREAYLDWSMLCDFLEINSTSLHRIIKKISNIESVKYKNRIYYKFDWAVTFWKIVSEEKLKEKFSTKIK